MNDLGHEGAVLFKRNGKYYLGAADDYEGRYSTCLGVSDNIYAHIGNATSRYPAGVERDFSRTKKGIGGAAISGMTPNLIFVKK